MCQKAPALLFSGSRFSKHTGITDPKEAVYGEYTRRVINDGMVRFAGQQLQMLKTLASLLVTLVRSIPMVRCGIYLYR
ncbi:MAG: hypothetical protein LBF75_11320 [Treponema sp.]|jgi:hypothetical protein|nr:hypothetical protein [Treponema sp.]